MNLETQKKGVLINLSSVFFTAAAPVIAKASISSHLNPAVSAFLGGIVITTISFVLLRRANIGGLTKISMIDFWIGVLNGIGTLCLFVALETSGPVVVGFVGRFIIVFGILFSILFFKERCSFLEGVLIALIFAGGFTFSSPHGDADAAWTGFLWAFAYAFLFACANALMKVSVKSNNSLKALFSYNLVSLAVLAFYIIVFEKNAISDLAVNNVALAFCSGLATGIGMYLYLEGSKRISFMSLNMMRALTPFVVVLYSLPFFPVHLSTKEWVGAGLITVGLVTLAYVRKPQAT